MSMEIIKRKSDGTTKEAIRRIKTDAPQIAYNSEGRITVRIPQLDGDVLIVFDRPLSREIILFVKNGISELPHTQTWCSECAQELNDHLPF
jgi:hypothetical protein